MKHYLVIGLLFSCALAVSAPPAQADPDRQTSYEAGPPPSPVVYDGTDSNCQPVVFTIEPRVHVTADVDRAPVADTTTNHHQPEGSSIHAHKPAQDDHPLRARGTVINRSVNSLPALPKRLPALHLSQAWTVPHREGQLHRITHY